MMRCALCVGRLAAVLALAACTAGSADFVKAGATREQVRADNAACRDEVEARYGRAADISHDINAAQSHAREDTSRLVRETRDFRDEAQYDRAFASCMVTRGYTRR